MNEQSMRRAIKVIRVLTVVGLILLAFLSLTYKFDHCSQCKYEWEGETVSANEIWGDYFEKCLWSQKSFDNPEIWKNITVVG